MKETEEQQILSRRSQQIDAAFERMQKKLDKIDKQTRLTYTYQKMISGVLQITYHFLKEIADSAFILTKSIIPKEEGSLKNSILILKSVGVEPH